MNIKLSAICGYGRPETAWQLILGVSEKLNQIHLEGNTHGNISPETILINGGQFTLSVPTAGKGRQESDIWALGATVFEFLMGVPVFSGKGEMVQTAKMPVPQVSNSYGEELSSLIRKCLDYDSKNRPDAASLHEIALKKSMEYSSVNGKTRKARNQENLLHGDLKYWKEEMK